MPILTGLVLTGAVASIWGVVKKTARKKQRTPNDINRSKTTLLSARQTKQPKILSAAEAEATQQQYVSLGALGSFGLSYLTLPWLVVPGIALLSYGLYSHLKKLRTALQKKGGNPSVLLLDAFSIGFAIYTGLFVVASMLFLVMATAQRLTAKTEREAQTDFSRIFGDLSSTVWVSLQGVEREMPLDELNMGDTIVVHAGDMIPVDGRITAGESLVDQHLLTGESQPVEKKAGDTVLTSTLVLSGTLHIMVEKQGKDTVTGQIAQALQHAATFKNQMQSRGDRIVEKGATFTLVSCAAALPMMGFNAALALSYSGFGYQMRTAAPLMVLNYLRIASRNGILIKDGRALDKLSTVDTIVFDKTGTLTEDVAQIARIVACNGMSEQQVLQYAASAEQRQQHPIAQAICSQSTGNPTALSGP